MARVHRARDRERALIGAQAAALRAGDALRGLLSAFEAAVGNAATNPRLGAALDARVDRQTLLDLLLHEPWWQPFRRAVDGHGIAREGDGPEVSSGLPGGLELASIVARARASDRTASALRVAGGELYLVAAGPIRLPGRAARPVLVAARRASAGALAPVAARANGAVAIADARRVLAGARGTGAPPDADELLELDETLQEPAGAVEPGANGVALAIVPLEGGLRLVVRAGAAAGPGAPAPGPDWPPWVILAVGALAAAGTFVRLGRGGRAARDEGAGLIRPATLTALGRYHVVGRIGQGGMAEVYAAVSQGQEGLRRPVVLKRLRPALAADPAAVARFCDEAKLLGALHHPNIVGAHDFGRIGQDLFLAQEYVHGRDLGRIVDRSVARDERPLPADVAAYVARELLEALDYAHNARDTEGRPLRIVHRDVSPENIMVSAHGEVKLLDFGMVKSAGSRRPASDHGAVKGNVVFMSPEQAQGREVDARADLYSLGLVMAFALMGRPLYRSQTTYGLLLAAGSGADPVELAAARDIPDSWRPILMRALAPRIEDRYQTARQMAEALAPLLGAGPREASALVARLFKRELAAESRLLAGARGGASPARGGRVPLAAGYGSSHVRDLAPSGAPADPAAGGGGGAEAGKRRGDRPLHRALPQGADWQPGRGGDPAGGGGEGALGRDRQAAGLRRR
jgi:hypothetical protein